MSLEQLKKNQILLGESGTYRVEETLRLVSATANVYRVLRQEDHISFTLKLMKPDLSPQMKTYFCDEIVNLQRLNVAEEKLFPSDPPNPRLSDICLPHIPKIIESSDSLLPITQQLLNQLGQPFFIMTFAHGQDLSSLMMDNSRVAEAEALEIIRQFTQVLRVIHSEGLTYPDINPDNLFWNRNDHHLTAIHWNVIGRDNFQTGASEDRRRAAALLFQMVTGYSIPLNTLTRHVMHQKYHHLENFKNLTGGTQTFLLKAFHPDLSSRHGGTRSQSQCTGAFLKALETQIQRIKNNTIPMGLKEESSTAVGCFDSEVEMIRNHLRYARTDEAIRGCQKLEVESVARDNVVILTELNRRAHNLNHALGRLEKIKRKRILFSGKKYLSRIATLMFEQEYLHTLQQIRQLVPQAEEPPEVALYPQLIQEFLQKVDSYLYSHILKGNTCLQAIHIPGCQQIAESLYEGLRLQRRELENLEIADFQESVYHTQITIIKANFHKWERWYIEFKKLIYWFEHAPYDFNSSQPANPMTMKEQWLKITRLRVVKDAVSSVTAFHLQELSEQPQPLAPLIPLKLISPLAFWLHHFFERQLNLLHIWNAIDENSQQASRLIGRFIDISGRKAFDEPLDLIKQRNTFFSQLQQLEMTSSPCIDSMEQLYQQGSRLLQQLRSFPLLQGKKYQVQLERQLSTLEQQLQEAVQGAIQQHTHTLEHLFQQMTDGWQDDILCFRIQNLAKQEILQLQELDSQQAQILEMRLQDIMRRLEQLKRKTQIDTCCTELDTLIKALYSTSQDHVERLRLEDQALKTIAKLGKNDPEIAQEYLKHLTQLLQKLLVQHTCTQDSTEMLQLYQFQRHIYEAWLKDNNINIQEYLDKMKFDEHFSDVVPHYMKRRANVLYRLEKIQQSHKEEQSILEALNQLRVEYGDFPEIRQTLSDTQLEIRKQENGKRFKRIEIEMNDAETTDQWKQLETQIQQVEPILLDSIDQENYNLIRNKIQYQNTIRNILHPDDFFSFLLHGKHEAVELWINALQWNVAENNDPMLLPGEVLKNLEQAEIRWLAHKRINIQSLFLLRRIKYFVAESCCDQFYPVKKKSVQFAMNPFNP